MKPKTYKTEDSKKENNVIFHLSSYDVAKSKKTYIIGATKSATYSKLDKAKKREEQKLKKELKDYTKYNQ